MRIETRAVHAGRGVDPATGAVTLPIHLSTTFERDADGSYPGGHVYGRNSNPTRAALETCLAALEGGAAAAAFASGSAATAAVFQALSPGDHVVAPHDSYFGTGHMLRTTFTRWQLDVSFVDMTNLDEVRAALKPGTKVVWVESPSNPMWKVSDIAAIAALAHGVGAACVCDNTVPTPVGQSPFELGADLVMHATTKYLGGHCDLLGGALVARAADDALFKGAVAVQASGGGIPSPFDCWLVLRGIQSLAWRMRAHADNAMKVATFLAGHPRVETVHYPGLPTHPGHAIAARQMRSFSGMLSFQVRGGAAEAMGVAAKLRLFTRATSFGGTESLVEHRASVEPPTTKTPQNLLRVSVGLEHPDDLIADLSEALA
ncbi:MAG: PLP-dependent transferase [Candidatus Rokubacteria bacterium]|nr:PLP-dependent transferase [Candidatus Rokubacteria bacterium]